MPNDVIFQGSFARELFMISFKRICIILLLSLQSLISFSTQPNEGTKKTSTPAKQAQLDLLKAENDMWKQAIAALSNPNLALVDSSGVTPLAQFKVPGGKITLAKMPPKVPLTLLEQLDERLHALRTAIDSRYEGSEKIEGEIIDILETNKTTIHTLRTQQRQTALMLAAKYGSLEACKRLVAFGANLTDEDL